MKFSWGCMIQHINGKCLSDEEVIQYYAGLVRQYGKIRARYKNVICFVFDTMHSRLTLGAFFIDRIFRQTF